MNYQMPPEWDQQWAMQLTWPHKDTDWCEYLDDINKVYVQMAKAIAARQKLIVVTPHPDEVMALLRLALTEGEMAQVVMHQCPTNDTWARDHAFITLKDTATGSKRFLDFRFNGWGDKFEASLDNMINRSLYASGVLDGEYVDMNRFVLEGGSIESDGRGTVFTTSCCLLAPHRNQPMQRGDIDRELRLRLGAERVVWIDYGSLMGDDTDGHIDTLVRTAPDSTLVYVGCTDPADPHYEGFRLMEQQLASFRTLNGKPYRLLKLPMAPAQYDDDCRLPATYANFVVINGAVIYPTYGCPELDMEAERVISQAFPGREMIGIDSRTVVRQHGSLHCCTMQYVE